MGGVGASEDALVEELGIELLLEGGPDRLLAAGRVELVQPMDLIIFDRGAGLADDLGEIGYYRDEFALPFELLSSEGGDGA